MFIFYCFIFIFFGLFPNESIGFFFGSLGGGGGGGCSCPPPQACPSSPPCPLPLPLPPPPCGGGGGGGPIPLFRPQQPFYQNNNNNNFGQFGGGGGGGGPQGPNGGGYALPQVLPSLQLLGGGGGGSPPSGPLAPGNQGYGGQQNYIQPAPVQPEASLPPPPPPPVHVPSPYSNTENIRETQSSQEEVMTQNNNNIFSDYDDKVSVEQTERVYNGAAATPPIPPPSSAASSTEDAYTKTQNQIEVSPSTQDSETPYKDKNLAEKDEFDLEIEQKPIKKVIETKTTPTTSKMTTPDMSAAAATSYEENEEVATTAPTTTTGHPTLLTTASSDIYDDKLPDIDELYENSTNKTKINKIFKSDTLSNDYTDSSFRTKIAGVKSRIANENDKDVKCGNASLRKIMMENIVSSPTISKQLIFSAGKQRFQKLIDVVCSRNKFSYTVVSSQIYCEVTKPPVTCFAFFQP